jgi:hypothetical protein
MKKVLEQYKEHAFRILMKAKKRGDVDPEGSSVLTPNERKGYAYYRAAIQTLEALINAPQPAWVGLAFDKTIRL